MAEYNEYEKPLPFKAWKAFNKDMTCLNQKYEEGKTYTFDGEIELCARGFHFCKDLVYILFFLNKMMEVKKIRCAE